MVFLAAARSDKSMSRNRSTMSCPRRLACILLVEFGRRKGLRHLARLRLDEGDERNHPAVDKSGKDRDDHEEANETRQGSPRRLRQSTTASLTDCNKSEGLRGSAPSRRASPRVRARCRRGREPRQTPKPNPPPRAIGPISMLSRRP